MNTIQKYYGINGAYLKEHKDYFSEKILKRDAEFIIKSLNLTKQDNCLELQCAQGRITVELALRGYKVDGLDFSDYMVDLARQSAKDRNLNINFFIQDINKLELSEKYAKVFLFFPDWTDLDFEEALPNISKVMKKGGLFLYDHDNIFRVWNYLEKNPKEKKKFIFDAISMTLKENNDKRGDRYYTFPELENIFRRNKFKIIATYGNWTIQNSEYNYNSPRLRVVAKKI
ncbi:hypothetical protein A2Y83_03735 [Candidatus Falkowbacteria bacterium RBG_13_39_14]|uniref:Methyltransferase domain-containing protein n=1 Tax=Candidatus Falkowbacteria bacterium RBG_13_39_14 TaxID=1797985 RepID=A0A1F5S1S4_9BACT|nr:MAG: hypothetical protein A2Y83_03735 [Candidatus Falkowbacteria bacterium RBG_13_39_14]